jgi:hypothetical protein
MSTVSRFRERGGLTPKIVSRAFYLGNGTLSSTEVTSSLVGTYETMSDVVTKPYQSGVSIVNNGMKRTSVVKNINPMSGQQNWTPSVPTSVCLIKGEMFSDNSVKANEMISQLSNYDYKNLERLACTQALAGVKRPDVSGLVAIKELRETIHGLTHPIDGILKFLDRNIGSKTPGKRRRSKNVKTFLQAKNLRKTASEISDQHLSIIFGLLPFISDIQGILKALREYDPLPQRYSSRGEASSFDTKTDSGSYVHYSDSASHQVMTRTVMVQRSVTVRAYQLYEASLTLQDQLGMSLHDVPSSIWQAATLSFVVDWFTNVGSFIKAITPVQGVKYLASGYTVTVVNAFTGSNDLVITKPGSNGWSGAYTGASQNVVSLEKTRRPATLQYHTGVAFKSNMHRDVLDTFKITAGLSLINQRLARLL